MHMTTMLYLAETCFQLCHRHAYFQHDYFSGMKIEAIYSMIFSHDLLLQLQIVEI